MYALTYREGGKNYTYPLKKKVTTLGRSGENDIVLHDVGISRFHAKIIIEGEKARIVDLMSRNGTKVNGTIISETELRDGDQIHLGRFPLNFLKLPTDKVVLSEERMLIEEGTIIKPLSELFPSFKEEAVTPVPKKAPPEEKKSAFFSILSQVAKALISLDSLEKILNAVMDLVFTYLPADRGFLMLYDEEGKRLIPKVTRHREGKKGEITISKTMADKVLKEKVAILTADAQTDSRFDKAASIRIHGIRSAMCVPLWNKDEVIGLIHIDSAMEKNVFTSDDLELLSSLANYAAVAIQRAQLTEKVKQEMKVRSKLERYHSPQVVNRIISSLEKTTHYELAATEREATILFSDIAGFSAFTEQMPPHEVALLLNRYFSLMTEVVFHYQGTLDKYIGDAIMAVFGAPFPQPDHAIRAAEVALEMQEKVKELNEKGDMEVELAIRIGINTGKVIAGDIGSPKRIDYTVLGTPVNIASRLEEEVAAPGEIVVGEETYKLIKDRFLLEPLGKKKLRGLKKPVESYRLIGKK
ncbi:MAG: GAF domain-containing protein [Acidobacteria bacterium]|nr:GAF domain-containing protein [Acidobacteriota bacterium]